MIKIIRLHVESKLKHLKLYLVLQHSYNFGPIQQLISLHIVKPAFDYGM